MHQHNQSALYRYRPIRAAQIAALLVRDIHNSFPQIQSDVDDEQVPAQHNNQIKHILTPLHGRNALLYCLFRSSAAKELLFPHCNAQCLLSFRRKPEQCVLPLPGLPL